MRAVLLGLGLCAIAPQSVWSLDACPTPSARALKCEDGVQKNLGKLSGAIAKCGAKAADLSFKGKPFDEGACRDAAISKYDATSVKLLGHGSCPPTLDQSNQSRLRDVVLPQVDAVDAEVFGCSTTTTIATTTSTTTTTTTMLGGMCFDIDGHITAQACTTKDDCPSNPDGHSGHFACCGDGVNDFGETCDKGPENCAADTFCSSDCTADCQSIGRCTGSGAQCLAAATDCPAGQGCCGNKTVDPGETCDDGNFVSGPGDFCPATCFIASCTAVPASSFGIQVTYTPPGGTTISGLGFFVDYPEGKITAATKGSSPFGVSVDLTDLVYAFNLEALKLGGLPTTVTPVSFQTCNGAAAPTAGDFTCTVTDASDDLGNVIDPSTLSCAVTVP